MTCKKCGVQHVATRGGRACVGHVKSRDGGPCTRIAMNGQDVCPAHGGRAPQNRAAGKRRQTEAKAKAAVLRKLGDTGQPITDPIATLCAIAGRAVRFMELIGEQVSTLDAREIDDQIRAEIALYERSMGRAATIVESLIRMGIAERLAKVEEEQTSAIVKFIDGVLTDLGHNPRAPEVAGVVARRLELVS